MAELRTDIRAGDWVDRYAPQRLRPYLRLARLDRPIGTWLLLFPCWWGIALAAGGWPDWRLIALFGIGAVVMRGAGCTFNDIVDRDFDAKVERTRVRPIPSGEVSVAAALTFLALQLAIGATILFSLAPLAIALGLLVIALIATYPFMKRITYWPQFFLGLNFNWGAIMGFAAARGDLKAPAIWLYLGGIAWTLGYDTIYAHQDKDDDVLIGVKSSALALGAWTRPFLFIFYAAAVALWAVAGERAGLGLPYRIALVGVLFQLFWQAARVDTASQPDCSEKFRSNRWTGWMLLLGIVAAHVL
ncbi:MAG TPA: 4-hydroxybenzoate octaprenyltransferase [Stellaceae bacterium]|nr:4-hydroxybenzoate octaprenyltransferase [Stellaceae bacterium]